MDLIIFFSGDYGSVSKKAKVYPVIHKVDRKLVSRNGKKESSFIVPVKRPEQGHIVHETPLYSGEEDLFEESQAYFQSADDSLYTPAPLIGIIFTLYCQQGSQI